MAGAAVYRVVPPLLQKRSPTIPILILHANASAGGVALSLTVASANGIGQATPIGIGLTLGVGAVGRVSTMSLSGVSVSLSPPSQLIPFIFYGTATPELIGTPAGDRAPEACPVPSLFVTPKPVFAVPPQSPSVSVIVPVSGSAMMVFVGVA